MNMTTWDCIRIWGLLHHTTWAIARNRQNELSELGTTMMRASVLFILKNIEGPITPTVLSRWLFREPQSVAALLNSMDREGLLRRCKDLDRKNMVRLELTERGEEIYRRSVEKVDVLSDILSGLSTEELATLEKYLLRLRSRAIRKLQLKRSVTNFLLQPPLDTMKTT